MTDGNDVHWMGFLSLSDGGAKVLKARLLRHTASIDAASADLDKNTVLANPRAFSPSQDRNIGVPSKNKYCTADMTSTINFWPERKL